MITKMKIKQLLLCATATLACNDDPRPRVACARLETAASGECAPVSVASIERREFEFERGGYTMHGTLRVPITDDPLYLPPGVVVIHGSGPQSREGSIDGTLGVSYSESVHVYASLADQLALRGFAVLTYDKRSCFTEVVEACVSSIHDYPGDPAMMSVHDFLEDGRAAALALAQEPDVADDILIVGHSQGAAFVPRLVNEEEVIRGGAMLAGSQLPIPDAVAGQYEDLADWIEAENPDDPLVDELRAAADEAHTALVAIAEGTYAGETYLGAPVEFWRSWMAVQDAFPAQLASSEVSLSAFFGDMDFNVGPAHVAQLHDWIAAGEAPVNVYTYPDLTHGFVLLTSTPPGHASEFASEVVDDLVQELTTTQSPP
jgi:dienelactone hydrolase